MQYKRLLGIDYGDVRIGLALSDLMQTISSPYKVIQNKNQDNSIDEICKIIQDNEVETVVIGLPVNMDGSEGDRAQVSRDFGEKLKQKTNVNIAFQDERLSSVEAEEMLIEANVRREDRKNLIDKVAASIILESYMNNKRGK